MSNYTLFIKSLTSKIFKILPLRESEIMGDRAYLSDYIDSLYIETLGQAINNKELSHNDNYNTVINILAYMNQYEVSLKTCKREVFKMLNLLNKIEESFGGDKDE